MEKNKVAKKKVDRIRKNSFRILNLGGRTRNITILTILGFVVVLFLVLFLIDNYRMNNNMDVLFSTWGRKYTPALSQPNPYNTYIIIDRTEVCDEALEYIGSEAGYDYYLPCIQSETIFIKYDNGWEETLKFALNENHLSVESLLNHDINLIKQTRKSENVVSCNKDNFEVNVFSDKKVYKTNEKISLWATLKYYGNQDNIKIYHGGGLMLFSITDSKDFNLEPVITMPLLSSVLEKNEVYHYNYQKSGGWNENDSDAKFWENFFKEKDLYLPLGEYTIKLNAAFSLSDQMDDIDLQCNLRIKVEK